jgi:hypothetical protein
MAIYAENGLASSTSGADAFIRNDLIATGGVIWVDSVHGSDSNAGNEGAPLATLAAAITTATANNGDIIVVKSGHTETLTSAIAVSKAGVKIFGIGEGSDAPRFTVNAAVDGLNITGASVEINNLYFPAGTTAINTARVNIDAANVRVKNCTFICGLYDSESITLTSNALYAEIESCSFSITADGPDTAIRVESASAVGLKIKDCSFDGDDYNFDNAAIYSTVAHLNFEYVGNTLTNEAGIVHTGAAKGFLSETIAGDGSQVQA